MMINTGYNSRKEVVTDLLFELDDICRKNNLKYTLTGTFANTVAEEGKFPDKYDYITIAMTQGDIERLIEIVNTSENKHREIEYFLNNPYARGFQIRYCNNDTTLINVKEIGNHVNYGMFIRIQTVWKVPDSRWRAKFVSTLKQGWKGSQKRLASCNYKRYIPAVILKCIVKLLGKNNVRRWLYNYNKKLKFINRWEDIPQNEKLSIGKGVFSGEADWNLKDLTIDGHHLYVADALLHRIVDPHPTHATVKINDIEDLCMPFKDILNSDIMKDLYTTQKSRDQYLFIVTRANKAVKVVNNAWQTYLMTRDVIRFKDLYNDEKLLEIENLINEDNALSCEEELLEYRLAKSKWRKLNISFIENAKVERLIAKADKKFNNEINS